jgi:hypothetical protein
MSKILNSNDLNDLKLKLASLMGNGYINFGTPDHEIMKYIPEYTTEQISAMFQEIIYENVEMDIEGLEDENDFFEGY